VGFSGPTPVRVPLSSTKWRNSIYICIREYIHVCVYIYIYLYAKTYAQIYTHIIRIQRFRIKYIWAPLGKKVARPVAGQNFHLKINIFKDSFKLLGLWECPTWFRSCNQRLIDMYICMSTDVQDFLVLFGSKHDPARPNLPSTLYHSHFRSLFLCRSFPSRLSLSLSLALSPSLSLPLYCVQTMRASLSYAYPGSRTAIPDQVRGLLVAFTKAPDCELIYNLHLLSWTCSTFPSLACFPSWNSARNQCTKALLWGLLKCRNHSRWSCWDHFFFVNGK